MSRKNRKKMQGRVLQVGNVRVEKWREERAPDGSRLRTGGNKGLGEIGNISGSHFHNPAHGLTTAIAEALDPTRAPSKVKSFKDMTPDERAEMERLYGSKR